MQRGTTRLLPLALLPLVAVTACLRGNQGRPPSSVFSPTIPQTWDEKALASIEVPLLNPEFSPKAVPRAYYERIPVRRVYRGYAVYAPGKEPAGYFDSLKQREPELLWDDTRKRPRLETEADWIKAGEIVFNAAIF